MLTTFLIAHRVLERVGFTSLVVLAPLLGRWLVPRPRLARWLAAASLLPVALLTLWPVHTSASARCALQWRVPTPDTLDLSNTALFLLPVLLAGVAARRPLAALVAGSALSAGVEAAQGALPALGRACDSNDWTTNTVGAVLGAVLAVVSLRAASPGDAARPGATPRGTPRRHLERAGAGALVLGLLAVVWVPAATEPRRAAAAAHYGCDAAPVGAPTSLPGGVSAYAARDGSLCLQGNGMTSSTPHDAAGSSQTLGSTEVGIVRPGTRHPVDGQGHPVQPQPVQGSDLLVWAVPLPAGTS